MEKVGQFLRKEPWVIAVVVSLLVFGIYSWVEYSRANEFYRINEEFREDEVLLTTTIIGQLARDVEERPHTCQFTATELLRAEEPYRTGALVEQLRTELSQVSPPSFESAAVYIGDVVNAREQSGAITESVAELELLTADNSKLDYCAEIASILSGATYLVELSTVEGVTVLLPNQLQNYWVRFDNAIEEFKAIDRVPTDFSGVHEKLNGNFQAMAVALRGDDNDVQTYITDIQVQIEAFDVTLNELRDVASDVNQLPDQLTQASIPLQPVYLQHLDTL